MPDPVDDLAALRRVAEGADNALALSLSYNGPSVEPADMVKFRRAFSPAVALCILARLEAAERDVAKLRRFLKISRDEGLEALTNAATFKEQRDEARRQVQWLMLFGAVADIEAEWRATQQETPDAG